MEQKKYYEHDLRKMPVYQLQEIARREKIIPAVANRLDRELLIKTILRYRGAEKALLIDDFRAEDYQRLEDVSTAADKSGVQRGHKRLAGACRKFLR